MCVIVCVHLSVTYYVLCFLFVLFYCLLCYCVIIPLWLGYHAQFHLVPFLPSVIIFLLLLFIIKCLKKDVDYFSFSFSLYHTTHITMVLLFLILFVSLLVFLFVVYLIVAVVLYYIILNYINSLFFVSCFVTRNCFFLYSFGHASSLKWKWNYNII